MTRRPWTLARSLALRFALSSLLLIGGVAGLSAWYLGQSVRRELSSLAQEELDEMRVLLTLEELTPAAFERIAEELSRQHLEVPIAWRVWTAEGELWGDFGATQLLEVELPAHAAPRETRWLGGGRAWRVDELGQGLVAGVLLDGREPLGLLRRYELFALVILAAGGALMVGAGALFGRRVARLLRAVAEGVRAVRSPDQPLELVLPEAPEEIRAVAESLHAMLAQIRREGERARLLTVGMAHDLRSPIQNLLGETEVALLRERSGDEYREVLTSHLEDLRELGRVVDNLVLLCAAPGSRQASVGTRFDLGDEFRLRLERQRERARRRGVTLEVETSGDLWIRGDREALLLAVENVVDNAIQWSPPAGTVAVHLRGERDALEVWVDDEGPGVPEDQRERVFEPFYRSAPLDGRRVGYGLGLALARSAVGAQGGAIRVESAPRGGARFHLRLPRGDERGDGRGGAQREPAA